MATTPALREQLAEAIDAGRGDVVVDLSGVTFIDSRGLSALLNALRRMTRSRRRLVIVAPGGPVRRVFEMSGLTGTFTIVGSRSEALG